MTHLETQGDDITSLYEISPVPMELMKDSSYWVTAPDMESFLESICNLSVKKNLIEKAGHESPKLHAWGVLDSVLRMMPRPQEVFLKPEQFLSYFISPKPPVENFIKDTNGVSFDFPLPAEQYPHVTTYLKSAFEALPLYVNETFARCHWQNIKLEISWDPAQNTIFENKEVGHQISPELFQQLMEDLQKTQLEREDLLKQISDFEIKVKDLEKQNPNPPSANLNPLPMEEISANETNPFHTLGQNMARMHDYMVRAQQLVTVLASPNKTNSTAKDAMKKVDWDFVKTQYPQIIRECFETMRKLQNKKPSPHLTSSSLPTPSEKELISKNSSMTSHSSLELNPHLDL